MRNGKIWAATAMLALSAASGCGSSTNLTPSVSGASPAIGFLARTLDVRLSGFDTAWSDQSTVDFGQGVTVNKVSAASPTALVVNVTIDASAPTGPRDITVTDGKNAEPYKMAFSVESPIKITIQGQVAQGSLASVHVDNRDFENLFDTTSVSPGLFQPPVFTNIDIAAPPGAALVVGNVTPFGIDATLTVDVMAGVTKADLDVVSGPKGGTQVHFPFPGALDIQARTPAMLPTGDTAGMVAKPFDSTLFIFTPSAGFSVADLKVVGDDMTAAPSYALLPKSGKFADLIAFTSANTFVTSSADPYYVIFADTSGVAGYNFTLTRAETAATKGAETEMNNTKAMANTVPSLPYVVMDATLAGATDEDWFKVTAVAGDVGKKIRVLTFAGDPMTDTLVDVFQMDGTTSLGGPSSDGDFHENFLSDTLAAAGTYYVKIYASPMFVAAHNKYNALIRIE
jgi:hypothetical protein